MFNLFSRPHAVKAVPDTDLEAFFHDHYYPYACATKKRPRFDLLVYQRHIAPGLGGLGLRQISLREIDKWKLGQLQLGLKNSTINKHIFLLNQLMKLASNWGFTDPNHHLLLKLKKLPIGDYSQKFLTQQEIGALLRGCQKSHHPFLFHVAKVLLLTGARIGELRNAVWGDIDEGTCMWRVPLSKSGRSRDIFLSQDALATFREVRREAAYLGLGTQPRDFVFTNPRSKTKYDSFYAAWYRVLEAEGLPTIRIHDLRHTYASILINNGVSIYEVQRLLGHSNITMTQRYAHPLKNKLHRRTEVVSNAILSGHVKPPGGHHPQL